MHVALMTAKGGNESIKDKNLIDVNGRTVMSYSLEAAKNSGLIEEVFVSTEDMKIAREADKHGAEVILRPLSLAKPNTNHGDAIFHAVVEIVAMHEDVEEDVDTVTILLGNNAMVTTGIIDTNIFALSMNKETDSVMTVWKAQDDHPYRAMQVNKKGYLESFMDLQSPHTNRQTYPDVYYYDQGPWTVKVSSFFEAWAKREQGIKVGPGPWWWMNNKCMPVIRQWVTGRDIHSELDVDVAEWFVKKGEK